jgi:hypothetical protein
MNVCVKISKKIYSMSFGNRQIDTVQLVTDDFLRNKGLKKGAKMYEKYRKNKGKEWIIVKQLKTLSGIPLSDRLKSILFYVTKICIFLQK